MRTNYILNYIDAAIEFIEENIGTQLTADFISENVHLSKFHLQRVFKSLVGKGLIEYSRSRKLTCSLVDLKDTEISVTKIGLKYGYNYEQSFTRAFRAEFAISPLEYRTNPRTMNITPKLDISLIQELENAVITRPFHVIKPSFKLGGILKQVKFSEKYECKPTALAVDFYFNHRRNIINPINQDVYFGYTIKDHEDDESTYYMTGLEINEDTELPVDFDVIDVPEAEYIVFKFIGFFPASEITWRHMTDIWDFRDKYLLNSKGIDYKIYNYFEYIDERICTDDYCELDLYVPLPDSSTIG